MQLDVRDTRHNQRFHNNNCTSEVVHILPQTSVSITQMVHNFNIGHNPQSVVNSVQHT